MHNFCNLTVPSACKRVFLAVLCKKETQKSHRLCISASTMASCWSGRRGSNSLPPPWQGGALPDELCPQVVPRAGIEPATRGFSVLCSTNWAIWAYTQYTCVNCGSRIWTCDLRVMSPTSFQTAPSRDMKLIISIEIKPMIGLEPITCWLQISCSANWATSA